MEVKEQKKEQETRGTSCNKKNSTWSVRYKLFHLQSGRTQRLHVERLWGLRPLRLLERGWMMS